MTINQYASMNMYSFRITKGRKDENWINPMQSLHMPNLKFNQQFEEHNEIIQGISGIMAQNMRIVYDEGFWQQ